MTKMPGYFWSEVTGNAGFAARDGAGALVFQDRMWLLGGWNPHDKIRFPTSCNSEVWCSEDGADWILVNPAAPWEGRHTAGYVVHDGRMWIVGGDCLQGRYQPDVWSSADGLQWECLTTQAPWGKRVLHHTVAFAGKIWVIGGQTLPPYGPAEEVFYSDVWCSANGSDWTQVADGLPWGPRGMIGGTAVFRDRIWLMGGGTYGTPGHPERRYCNDVWSSADGWAWKRHSAAAPWQPRQYHDVAVFDDKLWVMEGYAGGTAEDRWANLGDVWYSDNGVDWKELPGTPWTARHAASVFVHRDALWMVAGNNMQPDVWKLVRKIPI